MQLGQGANKQEKRWSGGGLRAITLLGIGAVLLSALVLRLVLLQLVEGGERREQAENNRIRLLPKAPERGELLDRYGKVLVSSQLTYSLFLDPLQVRPRKWPAVLERLAPYTGMSTEEMYRKLRIAGFRSPYPVRLLQGLDPAFVIRMKEHEADLPGVRVDAELSRFYPHGNLASQVLGYTGEISEKELDRRKDQGYKLGDIVGKMGSEQLFESQLHGQWGGQQVEVDASGQVKRVLGTIKSQKGGDVSLSLDLDMQKAAEAGLKGRMGAVVVMDPRTGEVLVMASNPGFNPNMFSHKINKKEWQEFRQLDHPFLNRGVRPYPPASTYKIIMTTAALESGLFTPKSVLNTFGSLQVGSRRFGEHNHRGFGTIGFPRALAVSSDTFFYQVGLRLGPERIGTMARKFGYGSRTSLNLQSESAGLVPSEAWKLRTFKQKWYPGDTANMAIGQGFNLSTPLQNAVMVSVIANGGYRVEPHLLKGAPAVKTSLSLKPETVSVVQNGLRQVVASGTARGSLGTTTFAGKTGTAEDFHSHRTHAVFVGYAPYNKPEIAVSVFVEGGGHGGTDAAPIAKKIYEVMISRKKGMQVVHPPAKTPKKVVR
jgi:penicillin-binding protein 2